ncbi:hypothetical protein [uncultured Flavonifractor sp.]|uniref:hypothetical protein n=1 Tax=uncultured Flavonifractor sp. TaxID=1193534 RepID=UPI002619C464|nr:hypothetical protein [uncultured Flavonifractor sp.]
MQAQLTVHFFLGANSPSGFYSLYDQLIDLEEAEELFILKGGPGCGKSSLMRRVGASMEAHGLAVEYIDCSGDPDSLDAVVIPALNTAIVDGTAPHVVEPRYPGLVESYVNLGACYNRAGLLPAREELKGCMKGYKGCYQRSYRCLTAAAQLAEDNRALLLTQSLEDKLARRARGILSREVKGTGPREGRSVQRFLGGITWKGEVCYFDTVELLCNRVYELSDTWGLAHGMLVQLAAGAMAAGRDVIVCPSPLCPQRMEHLLIPQLSLAFVSTTAAHPWPHKPYRRIRLDAMADPELARRNRARLRFARKVSAALLEEAVDALAQAKAMHDELERLYNPHVDFAQVYAMADQLTEHLEARL